jgi:hypothetical protein
MAEVSEHPPQTGGHRTCRVVIDDYPMVVPDTSAAQQPGELVSFRQRVTAGSFWRAEITIQIQESRAGDMVPAVFRSSLSWVRQVPASVDDPEIVIRQLSGQFFNADQWVHHGNQYVRVTFNLPLAKRDSAVFRVSRGTGTSIWTVYG